MPSSCVDGGFARFVVYPNFTQGGNDGFLGKLEEAALGCRLLLAGATGFEETERRIV